MTTPDVLHVDIPIRTVSNAREHWRVAACRKSRERDTTSKAWLAAGGRGLHDGEHARILLTRVAPRPLDEHENLPYSFKACVDQLAECLGFPKRDNNPRLKWEYAQQRGKPRDYRVLVRVEYSRPEEP